MAAAMPPYRVRHRPDARLPRAVEIGIVADADPLHGEHEGFRQRVDAAGVGHPERAVDAVITVIDLGVALHGAEVRQNVRIGPPGAAPEKGVPAIEVLALAAHVDHRIDGAAAAENPRLRHDRRASVELRLRDGLVHLQIVFAREIFHVAGGHLQDRRLLLLSSLDQENPRAAVANEPGRGDAAGGAAADDDVVVMIRHDPPGANSASRLFHAAISGQNSV